jgi:hypothetical protein
MFTMGGKEMTELETKTEIGMGKKLLGKLSMGLAGLVLAGALTGVGCDKIGGKEVPDHPVTITLGVSEYESLTGDRGCQFGYLGMSSKDFFKLDGCYDGGVIDSASYSVEADEICFGTEVLKVLEVTPEHISLKYLPSEHCD